MRRPFLLACLALGLQACTLPSLDVMPRYGVFSVDGDVSLASGPATGRADLKEAGLDDDGGSFQGRADLKFGAPHLVVFAQNPTFEGSGVATADITFGGNTITTGTMVDSRVDLGLYSGYLLFDVFPGSLIELGLGFGASYIDLDLSFRDQLSTNAVTADEAFPLPMLAATAGVQLGPLELSALVAGLKLQYDGDEIYYLDVDVFGRVKILGGDSHVRGSLVAGVRGQRLDVTYTDGGDTADAEIDMIGPYAGIEITL